MSRSRLRTDRRRRIAPLNKRTRGSD